MQIRFADYPPIVRKAIIFLIAGWAVHYFFFFTHLETMLFSEAASGSRPDRTVYLQLGVGICICYFVAAINRWARSLCLWFNLIVVVTYGLLFLIFVQQGALVPGIITAVVVFLFVMTSIYLLNKQTADFFKTYGYANGRDSEHSES
jgi:hypothetical protein